MDHRRTTSRSSPAPPRSCSCPRCATRSASRSSRRSSPSSWRRSRRTRSRGSTSAARGSILTTALGVSIFPVDLDRHAAVQPVAQHRAVRHVARPDHPVPVAHAADLDLDAVGVLPADPVGAGAGRTGRRGDDVAGVPQGDRAARRAGRVHHRAHRVLHRVERLRLRHLADVDERGRARCPRRSRSSPGASQFEEPTGAISAAAVVVTIPVVILVLLFQRQIVSGLTQGAVKG